MTQQGKELIVQQGQGAYAPTLQQALSPEDISAQIQLIQQVMKNNMQEGVHYGVIPGTSGKPSLLKAGGEKLQLLFRFNASFETGITDLGKGHREYRVTCTLSRLDGSLAGQGVGSCSTMESKYRYRGKGEYRTENPNIADVYNTVLKMAKKRAHVDAIITATACSDIFTQDLEDMELPEKQGQQGQGKVVVTTTATARAEEHVEQAATPAPVARSQRGQGVAKGGEVLTSFQVPGAFWKPENKGQAAGFKLLEAVDPSLKGKKLGTVKGEDGKWYIAIRGPGLSKKAEERVDFDNPPAWGDDDIAFAQSGTPTAETDDGLETI